MKISVQRQKLWHLWTKIVWDNKRIKQVSYFVYLDCGITYGVDHRFQSVCGTIRRVLSMETRKETRLKLYKVMPVPVLLYGSGTWVPANRIQASEMRFLRSVKRYARRDRRHSEKS